MEDLLKALEPLRIPKELIGIFALAVYFWPHLRTALTDWRKRTSQWSHYRSQLELLKLRCDIEVLRRANNLEGADFALPSIPVIASKRSLRALQQPTSNLRRFQFGVLGSSATLMVGLLYVYFAPTLSFNADVSGYFIPILVYIAVAVVGGLLALPLRFSTRWHSFAIGATFPLVLVSLALYFQF